MDKITWITANCFLDVDIPIITEISKYYNIDWYIYIQKENEINYLPLINKVSRTNLTKQIIYLKNRIRNPFLLYEYINSIYKIKKSKANIYYIDLTGAPYFLPLFKFIIGDKKTTIAIHNISTPKGAINSRLANIYTNYCIKAFKNIHVFSNSQKRILEKKQKNKNILLAPLALKDFGKISISNKESIEKKIEFLSFGYIRTYKRIDVLIEAAQLAYEATKIPFLVKIAGSCNDWDIYQKKIKYNFLFELKITSIPNEEIAEIFSTANYFVLPYQDIAQSGAITVALNYNVPVIASNLEAFREIIKDKDTGFLFKAASIKDLKEIIIYILKNHKEIYPQLKLRQKIYVEEHYSNQVIAQKYLNFFNQL
ncbi:MAG: glycosyltransferase [Bacteroides sp.]|jgi:glycosyltransferase involved in cell wall biosynthesis|nr:glycosyltransferase [Bacteroides sp.]